MRTLLVGDVHGCAKPLARLLEIAQPDRLILLGDLFSKGPDPAGVWALIQAWRAECILGNHDARVLECWDGPSDAHHFKVARRLPPEVRPWLAGLPLYLEGVTDEGPHAGVPWLCVHAGIHPTAGKTWTTRRQALILRRWPDDSPRFDGKESPFWWQLYTGDTLVFYGHDAVRGLQLHAKTIGLDSGCVYGNPLSGYLLEEGKIVQVPGNNALGNHTP